MARAWGWVRDEVHGQVPEESTSQAAGTEYFSLDVEDVPAAGLRPGVLAEPRPQERVPRHTVEPIVDLVRVAPMVQIIDAPVPLMVEQLPDITRFFDTLLPVPEQVIEVPKILPDDVLVGTAVRDTQLVEQLVEVPTLVSHSPEGEPSCRGPGSSVASQVPTIVGGLAGEARSLPEHCTERCDEHYSAGSYVSSAESWHRGHFALGDCARFP